MRTTPTTSTVARERLMFTDNFRVSYVGLLTANCSRGRDTLRCRFFSQSWLRHGRLHCLWNHPLVSVCSANPVTAMRQKGERKGEGERRERGREEEKEMGRGRGKALIFTWRKKTHKHVPIVCMFNFKMARLCWKFTCLSCSLYRVENKIRDPLGWYYD